MVMFVHAKRLASNLFLGLRQKGLRYWTGALIVFLLTIVGSTSVYSYLGLEHLRALYFQFLLEHGPRPPQPNFVSLVMVEDNEYWNGPPAGRVPFDRAYLAKVVKSLASANNAHTIAVDIDTRLPNPESMRIPKEYREETCTLIGAIKDAARSGKKIVLATPISYDEQRRYRQDSDIYQSKGLCERFGRAVSDTKACDVEFETQEKENIACGFIALPYDLLAIPQQIDMADGGTLDSFALAIAKAERPRVVDKLLRENKTTVRYGSFISESGFQQYDARVSAADLLSGTGKIKLPGAVIVGADWSTYAIGRGPRVDLHPTPIGELVGAVLHANFAEAILDNRTVGAAPDWLLHVTEALFSVSAGVIFALISGIWEKIAAMAALFFVLFFAQLAALYGFAMFFDAFFPVLGLGLHSLYEKLVGTHEAARHLDET
jgi:CHASE2 domain-containing sensor protein